MSTTSDYPERLNLAEQVARVERMNMETAKLREELTKFRADPEQAARLERSQEETRKFVAEQHKLMAEGAKFERDRGLAPWLAAAAVGGAASAVVALMLRGLGVGG